MKRGRLTALVLTAFAVSMLHSCAAKEPKASVRSGTSWGAQELIASARSLADMSQNEQSRSKARDLAEQGIEASERCLMLAPEEPGCYYWRAVNTGLYHKVHVIGYQRGVKRMIEDCQKVVEIDPRYDHAGAYRILGELYTRLPQTGGNVDSVTRDLTLAEKYLREAVRIAPDYPENYILLAEALLAQDNFKETAEAISSAERLAPHWKNDVSYKGWQSSILALEKKVGRGRK